MKIDRLAVWLNTIGYRSADLVAFAGRLESWGYPMLWINEGMVGDPMIQAALLLAKTERLQLATGIASTYSRDATAMVAAQYGLNEQSDGRFLLGIGISHTFIVEDMRGHTYLKPVPTMKAYLEQMARIEYSGPPVPEKPLTVIAALGPKMLEVAATMADGAHPFSTTPEHTAMARSILGPEKLLLVEQKVMLETDPAKARAVGRPIAAGSGALPNYRNNMLRMGFTTEDFENGGSDRLADALLAWGDEAAIRRRIQEHWDAGADQVSIQVMPKGGGLLTPEDEKLFELLAPGESSGAQL